MEVVTRSVAVDAGRSNSSPRWQDRGRNRFEETAQKQGLINIWDDEGVHQVASEGNPPFQEKGQ